MTPSIRNLDGIYIRVKLDDKWQSRCLTDCPWEVVEDWLHSQVTRSDRIEDVIIFTVATIKHLHSQLRKVGDELGIEVEAGKTSPSAE